MATLESLTNPLDRLQVLPTGMNWRGLWNNTTQFYQNDVVLSPLTTAPYLLTRLALAGGADPSTAPADWAELAPATGGITGLTAGNGISITGTPTIPQINNTGVLSVVAGTGITNTGTAEQPILQNTGITALNVGTGIGSTGGQTPTLSNTGVISITTTPNSGITITGNPQQPTIVNSGILALTAGAGISINPVPAPNQPTIVNAGVVQVNAGTGITISGPTATPTISLTASAQDPIATMLSLVLIGPVNAGQTQPNSVLFPNPASELAQQLLNGSPDPNGEWVLDFSGICGYVAPPAGGTNSIVIAIEDNTTTGGPFTYTGVAPYGTIFLSGNPPNYFDLGKFVLNVAACRATGFRVLDTFLISNDTGGLFSPMSFGCVPCYYYPNGLQ